MLKKPSLMLKRQWFIEAKQTPIEQDYEIDVSQPLGSGSFGTVFRGRKRQPGVQHEWRAIKQLHKRKLKRSATNEFQNEIEILQKLDHPNIVKLYETYQDTRSIYLVTELCTGGQVFDKIMEKGHFDQAEARDVFKQILLAINYCHKQGVVHRDIKPQNFLYLNQEPMSSIKLIDFGLSYKYVETEESEKAEKGLMKKAGTIHYMAPEVIDGHYDHRCDIWSLGVILYVLITGVYPFDGQTEEQIFDKITSIQYTLQIPEMNYASDKVKALIAKILVPFEKRPTIQQILEDEWFSAGELKKRLITNAHNMKLFSKYNKLKKTAVTLMATQIQERQIVSLGNLFKQIDKDNDGILSFKELKEAIELDQLERIDSKQQLKMMESIDTDKDGLIQYTQFIASTMSPSLIYEPENIHNAFALLDKDNNGKISKSELKHALSNKDFKIEEAVVDQMMEEGDVNKDGFIDMEEFTNMISKPI